MIFSVLELILLIGIAVLSSFFCALALIVAYSSKNNVCLILDENGDIYSLNIESSDKGIITGKSRLALVRIETYSDNDGG